MRRYRFRLERLLSIRRHHEREWELKLARATGAVLATESAMASAAGGISSSLGFGTAVAGGELDVAAVIAAETYREGMEARIRFLEGQLEGQRQELEEVRVGYLDVSRQRKVLDKLKERQAEAARRTGLREEVASLNDMAQGVAARQAGSAAAERL